ncbi:MAG: hypothetical protein ACRDOI_17080 [Trebonia sp.]
MNAVTWQQTGDRRTWCAARGQLVLTVTKLTSGMFAGHFEGLAGRSPECRTRLAAQRWAEQYAGVAR